MDKISLILLFVAIVIQFFIIIKYKKEFLFRPKITIPVIILLMILLGNINLSFFQNVIGWYNNIERDSANFYALTGLITLQLVILTGRIQTVEKFKIFYRPDTSLTEYRFCFLLTILAALFNIFNYKAIGGLLIFNTGLDGYERFELSLPFHKALNLSSFLLTLSFIGLVTNVSRRKSYIILFIINLIFSIGIGSRHLVLMPLMTAIFFLSRLEFIKIKKTLFFAVFGVFLLFGLSWVRGDNSKNAFASWESAAGGEYRDYIRLTNENFTPQKGTTMLSILLNPIPKQFYDFLDLNKDEYRVYSAYILMDFWGNSTGQRSGIWGEFFLNWRYKGMIVCFLFYGFLIKFIDRKLIKYNISRKENLLVFCYFYSLLFFSVQGSWATIGDDLATYGLFHLGYYLVIKYKIEKFKRYNL